MGARVTRTACRPDEVRVKRCARVPELGPRILFFSGGTALRDLSRHLKLYTHNSIHLITPFDSGGSSAKLRETFGMLAVGDLRNRMMALADETVRGNPEIYELFSYRFPHDLPAAELGKRLGAMVAGDDPLVTNVPEPMRQTIRMHLSQVADRMPRSFDLRGASIGNLVLAGGYLANDRDIESMVLMFSQLVEVRGVVRPVADVDLHLMCELDDGTRLVGQHLVTGKEGTPIASPVRDLCLVSGPDDLQPVRAEVHPRIAPLISEADLICYPIGSFYSSIVANLLPAGIGSAIANADCPKLYIPNSGPEPDPEQLGMELADCVETLIRFVRRDAGDEIPATRILDLVLLDRRALEVIDSAEIERVERLGITVAGTDTAVSDADTRHDAEKLAQVLISLA